MADQTRDGFQFRAALTQGSGVDTNVTYNAGTDNERTVNLDPRILSTGAAYQHNMAGGHQIWVAVAYELHDDLSAKVLSDGFGNLSAQCSDSENEAYRLAGRYRHDWGDGQSTWIAAMYEQLDYEADDCTKTDGTDFTAVAGDQAPIWAGVERDAFMISGKHSFGNGFDVRFSYMDADELDCDREVCVDNPNTPLFNERTAVKPDTDADAFNIGLFYTMPAGTELRATYSEVNNERYSQYDYGINGSGLGIGSDVEMFAVGIVHWFD